MAYTGKLKDAYFAIRRLGFSRVIATVVYRVKIHLPILISGKFDVSNNLVFKGNSFESIIGKDFTVKKDDLFTFLGITRRVIISGKKIIVSGSEITYLWRFNFHYVYWILADGVSYEYVNEYLQSIHSLKSDRRVIWHPYVVSLRIRNLIKYIRKSNQQELLHLDSLRYHVKYLERNLEYRLGANHLMENYASLTMYYSVCGHEANMHKYLGLFKKELSDSVKTDGRHYECSLSYQVLVLQAISDVKRCLTDISLLTHLDNYENVLKLFLAKEGLCSGFFWLYNDVNYDLLDRNWLNQEILPLTKSSELSENIFLFGQESALRFNIEMPSPKFNPGHSHDGLLGIEVYWGGIPFITELGCSTYDPNDRRSLERSSRAHSTFSNQDLGHFNLYKSFRLGKLPYDLKFQRMDSKMNAELVDAFGFTSSREISFTESGFIVRDSIKRNHRMAEMTGRFIIDCTWRLFKQDSDEIIFICNTRRIKLSLDKNIVLDSITREVAHRSPSHSFPVLILKYHNNTKKDSIFYFEEITDHN